MSKLQVLLSPKRIILLALAALICVGTVYLVNTRAFLDWSAGLSYRPTAEMSAIQSSLALTGQGERIFAATHPAIEERDAFNARCQSYDANISVLGCYTHDRIYLYNIQSTELAGIMESTAAHELLHAVWERLSTEERTRLTPLLEQVYAEHSDLLADELDVYTPSNQTDELHARIGTQIANLPPELEDHYGQYFTDQDAVVVFYDDYSEPFRELSEEIDRLSTELEQLENSITAKTMDYTTQMSQFGTAVNQFNSCAETAGCFTDAEFNRQRAELVAEQANLEALYQTINQEIERYNQLVDTYNQHLLRTRNLQDSMNSNAPPPTI